MALLVEETKIVTIDEKPRAVETLPEGAKNLVRFYDDWKARELNARSELLLAQTGMRALAAEIARLVAEADAATAAAAVAPAGDAAELSVTCEDPISAGTKKKAPNA